MDANALFQVIQLILRLLIYTFIGKGLLALLAGPGYRNNAVWRFFEAVTRPAWRLTRTLAPRFVRDGAIAWLAVFLLILANLCLYMLFHYLGWLTPPRGAGPA